MLNVLYIWLNVHVSMHCSYSMNNVRGADKKRRRQKHRRKDVDQLSKRSFQLYHDCSSPFSLITHLLMSKPCYREWQNTFNLLRPRLVPPITLCTFFGSWSENGHPWFDLAIFIVHHRRKKKGLMWTQSQFLSFTSHPTVGQISFTCRSLWSLSNL